MTLHSGGNHHFLPVYNPGKGTHAGAILLIVTSSWSQQSLRGSYSTESMQKPIVMICVQHIYTYTFK